MTGIEAVADQNWVSAVLDYLHRQLQQATTVERHGRRPEACLRCADSANAVDLSSINRVCFFHSEDQQVGYCRLDQVRCDEELVATEPAVAC